MQINFQDGVEDIYDACVAKGSTPVSTSLSDVVAGIMAIPTGITPSGTRSITANGTYDVTSYASASVSVSNSNSGTYTFASGSTGAKVDLGATNTYRYVVATNVYAAGKAVKHTGYVFMQKTGCRVCKTNSVSDYVFWSTSSASDWESKGSFSL